MIATFSVIILSRSACERENKIVFRFLERELTEIIIRLKIIYPGTHTQKSKPAKKNNIQETHF